MLDVWLCHCELPFPIDVTSAFLRQTWEPASSIKAIALSGRNPSLKANIRSETINQKTYPQLAKNIQLAKEMIKNKKRNQGKSLHLIYRFDKRAAATIASCS